jgi:uncharacterized membrane protein YkoI
LRNNTRAFLLTVLLPITGVAIAQGVAQPGYSKMDISGFHGTKDTLVNAIRAIERGTGGKVTEIRFSETQGLPGYHAVVSKSGRIEFIHVQEDSANIVQIDAASGPAWMLKWRGRTDVHFADTARVSLSAAVVAAEQSKNGAPAVAAGIARSASNPTSDVQAYNVMLDMDGSAHRVSVDDSSGEIVSDPSALTDF